MKKLSGFLIIWLLAGCGDVFAWTAPVGIPTPSWPTGGIDQNRPTLPSPWTSDQAGFYYIAPSGSCSDSGRTYGNPTAARCTLPSSPTAGSVIAIAPGSYPAGFTISFSGTSGSPTWVMAYNTGSKPSTAGYLVSGSYIIVDGINASGNGGVVSLPSDHVLVRNGSFSDSATGWGSAVAISGDYIIYYNNTITASGDWQTPTSTDHHGIKVDGDGTTPSDIWIVDSTFYHCQGDGVQIGDSAGRNVASGINRVYVGRNVGYENMQSCFWTKNATDVIMSENICHDITYSDGGDGQGIGGQYDAVRVWFLANKIYNTKTGIKVSGPESGGGGPWYAIGNLIYNVASDSGGCNNYNVGALAYRNDGGFIALFNTIYNVDMFFTAPSGGSYTANNNILSVKQGSCNAVDIGITFNHNYNLDSTSTWVADTNGQTEAASATFTTPGSDFSLKSTSLAVGNANPTEEAAFAAFQSRYGIDIRKDFIGTTRPQSTTWDIGAYEYTTGGGGSTVSLGSVLLGR